MTRLPRLFILLALLMGLIIPTTMLAQGDTVTVPNVTGLSVPEAAALLNRAGINLGTEHGVPWTESSGLPKNKISAQSVPAGQQVQQGSAVDVTVLRVTNVLLLYDYIMLTLINKTGQTLDLSDVSLSAFEARRWPQRQVLDGQCVQIWAISRGGPQNVAECAKVQTWLFSTNKSNHFWRSTPSNNQFSFTKGDVQYGQCPTANPESGAMRCDIYLAQDAQAEWTGYIYFAYTTETLVVRNRSKAAWMPLSGVIVVNNLPHVAGHTFPVGDPNSYRIRAPAGRVDRLAPGQCIWFTNSKPEVTTPPEACDVIARLNIGPDLIFWASDFGVDGVLDDIPHTCPKATPGKLTICIIPR